MQLKVLGIRMKMTNTSVDAVDVSLVHSFASSANIEVPSPEESKMEISSQPSQPGTPESAKFARRPPSTAYGSSDDDSLHPSQH